MEKDFDKGRRIMTAMMPLMNFLDEGKFVQKIKHGCELTGLKAGKPRACRCCRSTRRRSSALATIVAALKREVAAIASDRPVAEPVR